jgi:hypothetical protein
MVKTVKFTDPSFQHKAIIWSIRRFSWTLLQIKKHTASRITNPSRLMLLSVSGIGGCQHEVPLREEAKAGGPTESQQVGCWVKDWKCLRLYCDRLLLHGRNMGWAWVIILHSPSLCWVAQSFGPVCLATRWQGLLFKKVLIILFLSNYLFWLLKITALDLLIAIIRTTSAVSLISSLSGYTSLSFIHLLEPCTPMYWKLVCFGTNL